MMNVSIVYDDLEDRFLWWVCEGPSARAKGESKQMVQAFDQAREAWEGM